MEVGGAVDGARQHRAGVHIVVPVPDLVVTVHVVLVQIQETGDKAVALETWYTGTTFMS